MSQTSNETQEQWNKKKWKNEQYRESALQQTNNGITSNKATEQWIQTGNETNKQWTYKH